VRWNTIIDTGDTPPADAERRAQELAAKHNCTVEVAFDDATGGMSVIVDGPQGAAQSLLQELGATDVAPENPNR
jgi:hypothetical protein